jgi:hypothetical protein
VRQVNITLGAERCLNDLWSAEAGLTKFPNYKRHAKERVWIVITARVEIDWRFRGDHTDRRIYLR